MTVSHEMTSTLTHPDRRTFAVQTYFVQGFGGEDELSTKMRAASDDSLSLPGGGGACVCSVVEWSVCLVG
jgi:hypothetical protein